MAENYNDHKTGKSTPFDMKLGQIVHLHYTQL